MTTKLSHDAIKTMFRCEDFPVNPLIVQIESCSDGETIVRDATDVAGVRLVGSTDATTTTTTTTTTTVIVNPTVVLIRGYIASEVNAGNVDPLVFVSTMDPLPEKAAAKLGAPTPPPFTLQAARIPGGKAYQFFETTINYLSIEDIAGVHSVLAASNKNFEWLQKEANITTFLDHHKAMVTLRRNNSASLTESYHSAVQEFYISQLDRQKATLVSNTNRENAARATTIDDNHARALDMALAEGSSASAYSLTPELLQQWHGQLCTGLHRFAGQVRPKQVQVRVGHTHFRDSTQIPTDLRSLCQSLHALEQRLQKNPTALNAVIFASAVLFGIADTHAFADGNGRLARIATNWALKRFGLPFCVTLFASPTQRQAYTAAIVQTRRNIYLKAHGDVSNDDLLDAFRSAGVLLPVVELLLDRLEKAVTECQKVVEDKSKAATEAGDVQAARIFRERAAAGVCLICLEQGPNIATLCCGQGIHLNCMAQWISSKNSCPQCRSELPALPQRVRAPTNNHAQVVVLDDDDDEDDTTSSEMQDDDTTTLTMHALQNLQQQHVAVNLGPDDTTTMSEDDTTTWFAVPPPLFVPQPPPQAMAAPDDTTSIDDTADDTTTLAGNSHQDHLPPYCSHQHCGNRSARDCVNACCGRCCVMHGQFYCHRHS